MYVSWGCVSVTSYWSLVLVRVLGVVFSIVLVFLSWSKYCVYYMYQVVLYRTVVLQQAKGVLGVPKLITEGCWRPYRLSTLPLSIQGPNGILIFHEGCCG